MEKKFGIFHTIEELNRAAAAQKKEGDYEALKGLALENNLTEMDAEDYFEGDYEPFCTPLDAAIGRLEMEAEELRLRSQLMDWKNMIISFCEDNPKLCEGVFSPDKNLLTVLAKALKLASKNRITVDSRIIKEAGLPESAAQIGMVGKDELKKIVEAYYLGGKAGEN